MIPELRPYQLSVIERAAEERRRGNRIIVIQASTGAGKTTIAASIVKRALAKNSRSLLIAHRRKLVDQISGRLEEFEINHGILMRGEMTYGQASVQVASRDTLLSRCVRNQWIGLPPADLVIIDEAHHAADPQCGYREMLENYPQATVLLLSATPVGPDGRGLGPWAQAIVCAAPTSELIEGGFLVPVKVFAPDRKVTRGKAKRGIAGDLVESWKQYGENQPTVLFTSRVQHSLDAVAQFNEAGIPAAHVDANTDDYARESAFEGIANGRLKVLSNVGIIGEGVDVPELGCCQLYCEVGGRVRFLQAIGRVMRPSAGKTHGILIDHSGAVFRHGFPDEDTEWTLEGNVDEAFSKRKEAGLTEQVHYCKPCEMLFKGLTCPQCGKMPQKPPRSIFAAPPVENTDELLIEAERNGTGVYSRDEKVKHWLRCCGVAANRNGTFGQAAAIYKQKYGDWPDGDFPCVPERWEWKTKVLEKYPNFKRGRKAATS